jgi:hypothetical protein
MAELIEYSMVVLLSIALAGASLSAYGAFAKFETSTEAQASFSDMMSLALQALDNGSSRSAVPFPNSTISCAAGVLSISSGEVDLNRTIPAHCDFMTDVPAGVHEAEFTYNSSSLSLVVK